MSTEIERNQDIILRCLNKIDLETEGRARPDGKRIQQETNLNPSQINDAIELLQHSGLVEWYLSLGTTPYDFAMVGITARGKNEVERSNLTRQTEAQPKDPRRVFVVHGRNLEARDALFTFLRSIDLHPLEWPEIVAETAKGTPYIGEILDRAFSQAQAVVVLMTPDDMGCLREHFRKPEDAPHETELTPQARLNVLFEAGMAMGRFPDRTILVELGACRPFSDVGGRHVIRLDNATEKRQELAQRLRDAGCSVDLSGTDWHTAGKLVVDSEYQEDMFKTLPFILQRFKETVDKPVKSNWSIRILYPNKHIEKCMVFLGSIRLPWWDKDTPYYEKTIVAGGGGNVRIPLEIEKEEADVEIMDGKRLLRRVRFKDIVIS